MPLDTLSVGLNLRMTSAVDSHSRKLKDDFGRNYVQQFTIGSGAANRANKGYADVRTLNGTETLDLSGSLTNGVGDTCAFTQVKFLYVRHLGTSGTLTVDTEVTNGATTLVKSIVLQAGDEFLVRWSAGRAITAGTADLLRITSSTNLDYEIAIAGE
jgi:hypothetical protein